MEYDSYECNTKYTMNNTPILVSWYTFRTSYGPRCHLHVHPRISLPNLRVSSQSAHSLIPYHIPSITNMDEISDYHDDHIRPQKKRRKYIAKAWYVPIGLIWSRLGNSGMLMGLFTHSNECKRRKIKCNGQTPCQRCGRQRIDCVYADNQRSMGDALYVRLQPGNRAREMNAKLTNTTIEHSTASPTK